jgi:mRNA-degrading endonuclease RelE of RelBE toxin-antitoxin system
MKKKAIRRNNKLYFNFINRIFFVPLLVLPIFIILTRGSTPHLQAKTSVSLQDTNIQKRESRLLSLSIKISFLNLNFLHPKNRIFELNFRIIYNYSSDNSTILNVVPLPISLDFTNISPW